MSVRLEEPPASSADEIELQLYEALQRGDIERLHGSRLLVHHASPGTAAAIEDIGEAGSVLH